jgi:cobalamin biosynthesis Mg chelatase CobN
MKNLNRITFILTLAGLLLSSCSSNLSFTKRRYTKGYFVEHHQKPSQPIATESSKSKAVNAEDKILVQTLTAHKSENETVKNKNVYTASAATAKNKSAKASHKPVSKADAVELAIKHPIKAIRTAKDLGQAATSEDARSLIWIIIVVILILYLLGLLFDGFGLGGLIHILAVIAVVLLILWLLRII